MTRKKILGVFLLSLLLGSLPLQGQGAIFKKDILVEPGEVQDNLISFGGEILVKGKVNESVINFGGTIIIEGYVGDSVVGFGTEIVLGSSAVVKGDVVSIGGTLDKRPGAVIDGDTVFFSVSDEFGRFLKGGLTGIFGISLLPLLLILKLITLFIWFLLAIITVALFPRQISFASQQVRTSFWPVFGTGLLTIFIFTALVVFSVFLVFILVGIPILLALVAVGVIIKIFGRVVAFHLLGRGLYRAVGRREPSALVAVLLGLVIFGFVGFIPIIGSLFAFVLSIIGWGVAVRTKLGTVENWFRKKVEVKAADQA